MIQFLSLSFDSPAKWSFLEIIFYLIFIVAIAVTAVFYIQLEINLAKKISGFVNILAWIHLLGMNIERSSSNHPHDFCRTGWFWNFVSIYRRKYRSTEYRNMNSFITPIAISIGILSVGVISGGITYIKRYFYGNKI